MGELVRCDQVAPAPEVLDRAVEVLSDGGVVVMPTDSVYGIGCAATPGCPGHARIFDIKRRDRAQTLPWLVADASDLDRYGADVPAWAHALAREYWPGALTLVVRASDEVPAEYRRAGDGTVALREPDSNLVRELARRIGCPLATTSANTHGAASPASGAALEPRIVAEADLSLDAGAAPVAVASTIVGIAADGSPAILREGAIAASDVMSVVAAASVDPVAASAPVDLPAEKYTRVVTEDLAVPSHDGSSTCRGTLWLPAGREPVCVVQLVHGMAEHIGRYDAFARELCSRGMAVAGVNHLGHGRTTPDPDRRGRLDSDHGADWLVEDQHSVRLELERRLPGVPVFVLGHSMGSFVTRCYIGRHGQGLAGAVIMGTAWQPGITPMRAMLRAIAAVRGWDFRSAFVDGLGCGGYNKKFEGTGAKTGVEWLSRDESSCVAYANDPDCGFVFSLGGYMTLSSLLREAQSRRAIAGVPDELPVLLISGSRDPVGADGDGPVRVFKALRAAGVSDLTLDLVDGARHELLNEVDAQNTTDEIADWILDHVQSVHNSTI
ncbi:L-threonylcarbamoyladenylate synthase [Atopobiaceae bacterium SGI.236]